MSDPNYDSRWHLDKRLNVGHLITTVMLAASVFAWGGAIDKRVAVVEAQIVQNAKDNDRQEAQIRANSSIIREEVRGIREEIRELNRNIESKFLGKPRT